MNQEEFKQVLEQCIEDAEVEIKEMNKGDLLALAKITLAELMEINGITIRKSQYGGLWIQPPCYRSNTGKYSKSIYFKDEAVWKMIEEHIKKEYKSKNSDEKVDIDDLPL